MSNKADEKMQRLINDALYWYQQNRNPTGFSDIALLRTNCLVEKLAQIGGMILEEEINKGRKYVPEAKNEG